MNDRVYYIPEISGAMEVVKKELALRGLAVVNAPCDTVTHLILGVPCRMDNNSIQALLMQLPKDVRIFGGFLKPKELAGYRCFDLLKDEPYLAQNAAITAHCALQVAMEQLPVTLEHCQVLITGWGRIGKCLAPLLKALGADVVIAVRKDDQRAIIKALGYEAETLPLPHYILPRFRMVFNTAPAMVLPEEASKYCRPDCLKIELASVPGMEGTGIVDARGLPGKLPPESSGKLSVQTVLRLSNQKEEVT